MQQNKIDLGRRIKYFRKRADMSQLELETSAGLAAGVISRIESNQVNPNKETILTIAKVFELNAKEIDYLIGITVLPATDREIEIAKEEAKDVINKRGKLAYLLDERWRFLMISDTFLKLLRVKTEELKYAIGRTTVETIVDTDSPVLARVDREFKEELIQNYLPYYYSVQSFMDDDPIYQRSVGAIMKHPMARDIWQKLVKEGKRIYLPEEDLVIHFDLFGYKIPLYYSIRDLPKYGRFEVVEFHTENKILDLLPKLI